MPTTYALNGVNFENQEFTPSSDCAIWRRCVHDGILQGMAITVAGSGIKVAAGWLMAGGKELQLPAAITVPATDQANGFARLVVNVDLSKTATEQSFQQGWIAIEYASSRAGFTALTKGDLAGSGSIYQMQLCVVSLSNSTISGIVTTCGYAYAHDLGVQLTLPATGWVNKQQTVRCDGVTADQNETHVTVTYDYASKAAFVSADIDCIAQGDGTLTFACGVVPTEAVTVNVKLS